MGGDPLVAVIAALAPSAQKSAMANEADRSTILMLVLRPVPGQSQERFDRLLDAALAAGVRWHDIADYVDAQEMRETARLLAAYAASRKLPPLFGDAL